MKICIDAGHNHSGVDTGAKGALYKEQDLTFLIADELKNVLENRGNTVIMTRKSITDNVDTKSLNASLTKRANIANAENCDFFVSIHINAGGGIGTETYVYSKESIAYNYAQKIQSGFENAGRINRGVKTASFSVLKNTKMPAILVECGFIDNKSEEVWIKENCKTIACIIASSFTASSNEYLSVDEAINLLNKNRIISETEKWKEYALNNEDICWLLRKTGTYLNT